MGVEKEAYICFGLVEYKEASTSLVQDTMEYFVENHLREPRDYEIG